jgi:peptide/nickel transport system substrate-binding protein
MNEHSKLQDMVGPRESLELLGALKRGATRRDLLALLAGGGMQLALAAGVAPCSTTG